MKRPITIISSISSLLFLVAIIWFGAGIYIDKKSGNEKASSRYQKLLNDTKSALFQSQYGSPDFSNKFIRAIGNIDDFSALKLEINGELVYSYPPSLFSLPSPDLVKHFEETVEVNPQNYFSLEASIYLMKPNSIYNYARIAFLLILVGTIIVVVLIILTNGTEDAIIRTGNFKFSKKKSYSNVYRPFSETESPQKSEETKIEASEETKELEKSVEENKVTSDEAPLEEKKPLFNPEASNSNAENTEAIQEEEISINFDDDKTDEENSNVNDWFIDTDEESENDGLDVIDQFEQQNAEDSELFTGFNEDEPIFESEPVTESPVIEQEKIIEEKQEKNISPITSLFVQSELEPKIDNEISSGSENLTVALLKINALDRGNSISSNVLSILKDKSSYENPEIFEYKSDSYAVVLPKTDLQTTVDMFETVYNKISDFLKNNNATNEVSVGISSVAGRKIKAERLLLEASQALDYASNDPDSPIVAFRANPEKYNEMQD